MNAVAEKPAVAVHLTQEVRVGSKEARIAAVEHLVGQDVRIVTGYSNGDKNGQVGKLQRIDRNDSALTFLVEPPDGADVWVYEVEPVDGLAEGIDNVAAAAEKSPEQQEIDRLTNTVQEQSRRFSALVERHDTFKTLVRDVAIRVAEEQGWCDDGLNAVLDELGLEPKAPPRKRVTLTLQVTLEGEPSREDVEADWVERSVNDVEVTLDSDWDDVSVEQWDVVTVTDIEDAD